MSDYDLNVVDGPLFLLNVIDTESSPGFTLNVGVNSSSFGGGSSSTGTVDVTVLSAEAIGIYRAVEATGFICETTSLSMGLYAGVTRKAIASGQNMSLVRSGILTEGGWTWIPNQPIFIGTAGVLTQVLTSNAIRRIGLAVSATQIYFDPYPTIGA